MSRASTALLLLALVGCSDADRGSAATQTSAPACASDRPRQVVAELGQQLRNVSLLAPDSVVRAAIRQYYGPLVSPELLDDWLADPARAPGRRVSSPWPARIEVDSIRAQNGCVVVGDVVSTTNVDTSAAVSRDHVTLSIDSVQWLITSYVAEPAAADSAAAPQDTSDAASAARVIAEYYDAIAARDYRRAYRLWRGQGSASGQTYEEFAAGFRETASVEVDAGEPGRIGAAAGSRYVEVPVTIRATTDQGEQQVFEGSYTLQRSVVDGASAEQRAWRIASARIARR